MNSDNDFSGLMDRIRAGDQAAAQCIWDQFHPGVVRFLGKRLPGHRRREFDEEDVAASAFLSFFEGVAAERFPDLNDSENLWRVIAVIAGRKALAYLRFNTREKRGGGRLRGESVFRETGVPGAGGIGEVGSDHAPETAAVDFEDYVAHLLTQLVRKDLQDVALLKLDGWPISDIAEQSGMTTRAVERRLAVIRQAWRETAELDETGQ